MNTQRLQDIREIRVGCLFIAVAVLCTPFLVLGGVFGFLGARGSFLQVADNAATRQVEVTIVSSEISRIQHRRRTDAFATIEFTYESGGEPRTSGRVHPSPNALPLAEAERLVAKYPAGAAALAWAPDRRGAAPFLEKGWFVSPYLSILVAILAWGFCGGLLTVSGGWAWVERSWIVGGSLTLLLLLFDGAAVAHALTHLPADTGRAWLIPAGLGVALVSLLPMLGAWQSGRIARLLADLPPEPAAAEEPTTDRARENA